MTAEQFKKENHLRCCGKCCATCKHGSDLCDDGVHECTLVEDDILRTDATDVCDKWEGKVCEGKGMANLYTVKVRYSLVEAYAVMASSEEEANAKIVADRIEKHKLTPVGCAYGDMKAEVISTECDYKEGS